MRTYAADEIFQDIPDDPDHVLMTIPPEIIKQLGWSEGTRISVSVQDGLMIIKPIGELNE